MRRHRPGGVRLDDADAQGLRHVAGIVHFQDVRPAGLADRQPVGLPTHVGRVGVGAQLGQLAQRVPPRLQAVVAQRPLPQPRQPGLRQLQLRQLVEFLEPARIGRIDLHHLRELAIGPRRRRPLRTEHQQLHPPLGDRPFPVQRLADRLRPVRIVHRRDRHVVDALVARARGFPGGSSPRGRPARRAAATKAPCRRREELDLDPRPAALGQRQAVRLERALERLAGGEHQAVARELTRSESPGARITSRRLPRLSSSLLTNSPERSASGISMVVGRVGIVGGRELHEQLRRRRGGNQHVDAVVAARAALADDELLRRRPDRRRATSSRARRPRCPTAAARRAIRR